MLINAVGLTGRLLPMAPRLAALAERGWTRSLREALPEATFDVPEGGYFVWLRLPGGLDSRALLPQADAAGMTYQPGSKFDASGALDPSWLRLSFARYPGADLIEGARRLGATARAAAG